VRLMDRMILGKERLSDKDPGVPSRVGRDRGAAEEYEGVKEAVVWRGTGCQGEALVAYYTVC